MNFLPVRAQSTLFVSSVALAFSALPVLGQTTPAAEITADPALPKPAAAESAMDRAKAAAAKVDAAAEVALLAIREEYRGALQDMFSLAAGPESDDDSIFAQHRKNALEAAAGRRKDLKNSTNAALENLRLTEGQFRATNPPEAALRHYSSHAALIKFRSYAENVNKESLLDKKEKYYHTRPPIYDHDVKSQARYVPPLVAVTPMGSEVIRVASSITLEEIRAGKYIPKAVANWPTERKRIVQEHERSAVVHANKVNRAQRERAKKFAADEYRLRTR